jgi:nucleoside-diphosphate kinase
MERTLAIIKPDAVKKQAVGKIIDIIEQAGFAINALKMIKLSPADAGKFYASHHGKPFYEPLVGFMSSGPIVVMVLRADNAISRWRQIMGATDPAKAESGTIRKMFGNFTRENATHGSDSPESAAREISFFFDEQELAGS